MMKLLPDIEFDEDIRLFMYRPRGVIDEAAVKKAISVLEDLEAKLQEPFNRFSDTPAADEVDLNFKYVIQVSLCRRLSYAGHPPVKSAILATDSTMIHYARLHALLTQGSRSKFVFSRTEAKPLSGWACLSKYWRRRVRILSNWVHQKRALAPRLRCEQACR
jgi:hypothetical protein